MSNPDPVQSTRPLEPEDAAHLTSGARLGRYEIKALLGAGGMGRVYRALDPTLGREVAIKALSHAFRDDAVSMRRFEREAKVLAALNHPNIAAIHGFEELDGDRYLVLEMIEGETLAQKIGRGPLFLKEALAIAVQVAEGLAEAHGKGVAHRDLKPSNVMITPGGRVKLVDFGLAKSTEGRSHTVESNLTTRVGTVVGTAPYMSPEQIQSDEVDTRTDVWAFGCVLYEMLTGRQAFQGRTAPEVVAAVLRDEPDLAALPQGTPRDVRRLIQRCLKKDLGERFQHIGDIRLELVDRSSELVLSDPSPVEPVPASAPKRPARRARPAALAATPIAIVLVLGALGLARLARRPAPLPAVSLSLELPRGLGLASELAAPFAISPDGSTIVVDAAEGGARRLYTRRLDDPEARPLAGTEGGVQPFFSPDGRSLAYFANRKLARIPVDGGAPLALADVGSNPRGATWPRAGTIVVAPSQTSGLVRVSDGGGPLDILTTLDAAHGERSHRWPEALPGGSWVLFTVAFEGASYDEARIEAVSLDTLERRVLVSGASYGRYASSGHLVFVRGGRVYAVELDPRTLRTTGTPEPVLSGVRYDPQNGAAHLALAGDVLLYGPAVPTSPETYVSWLDRKGQLTRLSDTPRLFRDPRVSPDGKRVAVVIGSTTKSDLWLVEGTGSLSQISFGLSPHRPIFAPDGRHVTIGAEKDGRWRLVTLADDGKGEARVLLEGGRRMYPCAWSADGRYLVFQQSSPETGWDLAVLEVDEAGRTLGSPQPLAASPFNEANATISPDGSWVSYESDELDALVQVYVRSFPDGDLKQRASTTGARWPCWRGDGTLYFWDTSRRRLLMSRTRFGDGHLLVYEGRPVFEEAGGTTPALGRVVVSVTGARFDVHPVDDRLLVLETSAPTVEPPLSRPVLVTGWGLQLRAKLHR